MRLLALGAMLMAVIAIASAQRRYYSIEDEYVPSPRFRVPTQRRVPVVSLADDDEQEEEEDDIEESPEDNSGDEVPVAKKGKQIDDGEDEASSKEEEEDKEDNNKVKLIPIKPPKKMKIPTVRIRRPPSKENEDDEMSDEIEDNDEDDEEKEGKDEEDVEDEDEDEISRKPPSRNRNNEGRIRPVKPPPGRKPPQLRFRKPQDDEHMKMDKHNMKNKKHKKTEEEEIEDSEEA